VIAYQTRSYNVTRERAGDGTLYVVTNLSGKVLRGPMALSAAREVADLYQGDDDTDAAQERACARLDGP
jgi:hypothetical protein